MWYPIAIVAGAVLLIVAVTWAAYRMGMKQGKSEVQRVIAQDEAEKREKDAVIAAAPAGKRPLDSLFK